ncbi:MAG: hypothetical protein M0Q92_10030 [Methanoregula sp.]|nr:hypothetical protein [Methanoregula sp.]
MTITWLEWLFEKGERNSRCYDFIEVRPFWTMGWFRAFLVLMVAGFAAWIFWPFF